MSDNFIMADGRVLATPQGQKRFSGGYLNYTPQTLPEYRGLTISPPETGVGALGLASPLDRAGAGDTVARFLSAIGYGPNDTVYIRAIAAKNTPQEVLLSRGLAFIPKGGQGAIPATKTGRLHLHPEGARLVAITKKRDTLLSDWSYPITQWNGLGRGVYFVVNHGSGFLNEEITFAWCLFFECDGISKAEQWAQVGDFEARGIYPTVVETHKSLHVYFRLTQPLTDLGQWVKLQQRLIQRQHSDPAIHNPARLMRVPGFDHWRWDDTEQCLKNQRVNLAQIGQPVPLETIEAILPEWDAARWDKTRAKASKAKGTRPEADHTPYAGDADSPWDIRNFAHYLEGFTPGGRPGWITAKCPAHNGQSLDSLHINESDGAFICHAGCDPSAIHRAARGIAESHGYMFPKGQGKAPTGDAQPKQQRRQQQRAKDTKLSPFLALAKSLGLPGDNPEREVHDYYAPGQVQPERIVVNALGGISEADTQNILTSKRPQLFDGVTGCGKTQVAADTRKHIDGAKLGLANTVVLCENLANRFDATAVHSRSSVIPTPDVFQDVVLNPEQFYRAAICEDPYQLLVIDECGVVLPRLLSGALGQNQQDKNLARAKRIGHDAPHRFFLQSNPTRTDLAAIEWLTGQSPEVIKIDRQGLPQSSVEVSILEDEHLPDGSTLSGLHTAAAAAIQGAKRGERWLIVAGSKDILKALQRQFRTHKVKATLRDGSYTLAPIAMGFGQNPTEHCNLANITLVSRQAETGVDLQNDFDCVVSLPSVQQSASEAWQQISRARALFDGRCKRLWIHYPTDTTKFLSVDHLDPAWHLARIKAKNRYYLSLLGGTEAYQATMRARLAEMESVMALRAHYEAEHAAGRWFQREYLTAEFSKRAWPLQTISPEPNALGFADFIQESRDKAKDSWSFAISHGKRWLEDYSEDYRKKIEDDTKASFVLDANRTKLALARQFPQSPLESKQWIRANIVDDPSKRYQTRLLGLLFLDNAQKAIDQSGTLLAREMGSHANEYGIISVLRKLEKSDLPMVRLAQALYPHRELILSVLLNGRRLIATDGNALALASSLKEMGDTLNQFARAYLEDSQGFDWTETEPMAIVNKFCSKFLGLALIESGQTRVDGAAIRQYAVGYSKDAVFRKVATLEARLEAKRQRLEAKQNTRLEKSMKQRVTPDTLAKLDAEIAGLQAEIRSLEADLATAQKDATEKWGRVSESAITHLEMAKSAAAGWIRRIENLAVAHGVQEFEGVALNLGVDTVISGLSATPPKNCTSPPDGVEPGLWTALMDAVKQAREWATAGQGTLQDALADIKAMALDAIGERGWQKLEAIA